VFSSALCVHLYILPDFGVTPPNLLSYAKIVGVSIVLLAFIVLVGPVRRCTYKVLAFLTEITTTEKNKKAGKMMMLFSSLPFLDEQKDEEHTHLNLIWDARPLAIGVKATSYSLGVVALIGALVVWLGYKYNLTNEGTVTQVVGYVVAITVCFMTAVRLANFLLMLKGNMCSAYPLAFCMVFALKDQAQSEKFESTLRAAINMTSFCHAVANTPRIVRLLQLVADEKEDKNVSSLLGMAADIFNEPTLNIFERQAYRKSAEKLASTYSKAFECFRNYKVLTKLNEPSV
jgi:hypothetical protein